MMEFRIEGYFGQTLQQDLQCLRDDTFREYLLRSGQQDIAELAMQALRQSGHAQLALVDEIRWRFRQPIGTTITVNGGQSVLRVDIAQSDSGFTGSVSLRRTCEYGYPFTQEYFTVGHNYVIGNVTMQSVDEDALTLLFSLNPRLRLQQGDIYYGSLRLDGVFVRQTVDVIVRVSAAQQGEDIRLRSLYELSLRYEADIEGCNRDFAAGRFEKSLRGTVSEELMQAAMRAPAKDKVRLLLLLTGMRRYVPLGKYQDGRGFIKDLSVNTMAQLRNEPVTYALRDAGTGFQPSQTGAGRFALDETPQALAGNWGSWMRMAAHAPRPDAAQRREHTGAGRAGRQTMLTLQFPALRRTLELDLAEQSRLFPVCTSDDYWYSFRRGRHFLVRRNRFLNAQGRVLLAKQGGCIACVIEKRTPLLRHVWNRLLGKRG